MTMVVLNLFRCRPKSDGAEFHFVIRHAGAILKSHHQFEVRFHGRKVVRIQTVENPLLWNVCRRDRHVACSAELHYAK